MSAPRLQIIVVGAGIGGLAAAVMLRSFADVTILESAHQLKEIGAAITIGCGAVSILRRFGIDLEKEGGVPVEAIRTWDTEGKVLATTEFHAKERLGEPPISVHRADIHSALLVKATSEDGPGKPCKVLVGHKVLSMDTEAGSVTTAAGETFHADVIVCADGIHSNARSFVLGNEAVDPVVSGESAYRMLIPVEDLRAIDHSFLVDGQLPPVINFVKDAEHKMVAFPIRGQTVLNVVAFVPDESLNQPITKKWTTQSSVGALLKSHETFSPFWKNMLAAAKDVGLWQIRDLPMLQTWTRGRAILIGDAAHAMLPHHGAGATSAIEDAEAVAFALRNATAASESVLKALAHVVQVRYKRATAFQVASRAQGLHAELDLQDGEKILEAWAYPGAEVWEQGRPEMILDV